MRTGTVCAVAFGAGLAAGVGVTVRAHRSPSSPWWDARVGGSRLRRSDLPVGGAVGLVAAGVAAVTGHRSAARFVALLALGAAAGAVGTGLARPLPRS